MKKNKLIVCFDMWGPYGPVPNCLSDKQLYNILEEWDGNYSDYSMNTKDSFDVSTKVSITDFWNPEFIKSGVLDFSPLGQISKNNKNFTKYSKYLKESDDENEKINFCYLIEPYGSMNKILYDDNFVKYMSEKAVDLISNKNGFLLINFSYEGLVDIEIFEKLHESLSSRNIPPQKVIWVYNDSNNFKTYNDWCDKRNIKKRIKVLNYQYSLWAKSKEYFKLSTNQDIKLIPDTTHKSTIVSEYEFKKSKDVIREHHFLSYNRMIREHRFLFLVGLFGLDLLGGNLVSYYFDFDLQSRTLKDYLGSHHFWLKESNVSEKQFNKKLSELFDIKSPNLWKNLGEKLIKSNKKIVDYENFKIITGYGSENYHPYINSYFSIITESTFFEDVLYLSEKSWKGFVHYHPFIMFGRPGMLKEMRKYGFKTFSPSIDESYDEETNSILRYFKIMKEVKRLCQMSLNEAHDWYWKMEDILIHNRNVVLEYGENNYDFKYKYLIKNIINSMGGK